MISVSCQPSSSPLLSFWLLLLSLFWPVGVQVSGLTALVSPDNYDNSNNNIHNNTPFCYYTSYYIVHRIVETMGLASKFRGKASSQPAPGSDGEATGTDVMQGETIEVSAEADLKKFKRLHKWDPFMDIEKLDAADKFVFHPWVLLCASLIPFQCPANWRS